MKKSSKKKQKKPIPKKRNRRSGVEFPALSPKYNLKTRQDEIEDIASYANQLSHADKKWLNAFVEEQINANFKHKGPKLNKTNKEKRLIYNKNNARNRDILTTAKAQGKAISIQDAFNSEEEMHDKLIEMFDGTKESTED